MKHLGTILFLMGSCIICFAQKKEQPPIPIEILFGNQRTAMQLSVNRAVLGKLYYMNATCATTDYQNTHGETEIVMNNYIIYKFHPRFGVSSGLQYHFLKGLVPSNALHISYATPLCFLALKEGLEYLPSLRSAATGVFELKPHLNDKISLYTRVQALYNYELNTRSHDRSYYYLRLGILIKRISFGIAANFDYYGPQKVEKNNFGGFFNVYI